MGCCNQAPNGGSSNLGLLCKTIAVIGVVLLVLVVLFG